MQSKGTACRYQSMRRPLGLVAWPAGGHLSDQRAPLGRRFSVGRPSQRTQWLMLPPKVWGPWGARGEWGLGGLGAWGCNLDGRVVGVFRNITKQMETSYRWNRSIDTKPLQNKGPTIYKTRGTTQPHSTCTFKTIPPWILKDSLLVMIGARRETLYIHNLHHATRVSF